MGNIKILDISCYYFQNPIYFGLNIFSYNINFNKKEYAKHL